MAGPVALSVIAPHEVVEFRIYAIWRDQEFITKFYLRFITDGEGPNPADTQTVALKVQALWRTSLKPLVPLNFIVRQYWAAKVHSSVRIPSVPPRWLVSYVDPTIVIAETADSGSSTETEWCPTTDSVTMNRFGAVRNRNWRSSVRFGPIAEADQNSSVVTDDAVDTYNTAFTAFALGPLWDAGLFTTQALACMFSPALAVGKLQTQMDDATQNIAEWRASKLVGSQRTRKIRAAGY